MYSTVVAGFLKGLRVGLGGRENLGLEVAEVVDGESKQISPLHIIDRLLNVFEIQIYRCIGNIDRQIDWIHRQIDVFKIQIYFINYLFFKKIFLVC